MYPNTSAFPKCRSASPHPPPSVVETDKIRIKTINLNELGLSDSSLGGSEATVRVQQTDANDNKTKDTYGRLLKQTRRVSRRDYEHCDKNNTLSRRLSLTTGQ